MPRNTVLLWHVNCQLQLNKWVLSCLKDPSNCRFLMSDGNWFHAAGADTTKDRRPKFVDVETTMTSDSNSLSDNFCRIGVAYTAVSHVDKVWRQCHFSTVTKFRLYTCCVLAVLLYGCETWSRTLTSTEWKKLEAFHMHCQRRILDISWTYFARNVDIRASYG